MLVPGLKDGRMFWKNVQQKTFIKATLEAHTKISFTFALTTSRKTELPKRTEIQALGNSIRLNKNVQ